MGHNPKLVVLLLWCIGSAFPVFAQAYHLSIPVKDSTGSNSPLAIRGDVSFEVQVSSDEVKTEWDINVSLTNISSKPIIAYEVSIEAMPDQGPGVHFLDQVDHFFRPRFSFLPGAQELIKGWPSRVSQTSPRKEGTQPTASEAVAKVLFVEFEDGSIFGRSDWGKSLSGARKVTVDRIQEILNTVQASGPDALETSLAAEVARRDNPAVTQALMNHLKETLKASGPDAAVSALNDSLKTAEARELVR